MSRGQTAISLNLATILISITITPKFIRKRGTLMICRGIHRFLSVALAGILSAMLAPLALADVTWTVDSSQTTVFIVPSIVIPATVLSPVVTLIGIPQTDPGTSGDPLLAHPQNSLVTSLGGSFKTIGSSFLTSINFGPRATTADQLTITANDNGNWLPQLDGGARDEDGSNPNFGVPTPANGAATMVRTTPLTGPLDTPPFDASLVPVDAGRLAIHELAGKPATPNGAIPVVNGQLNLTTLLLSDSLGASMNLYEPITNNQLGPGLLTRAELIIAQRVVGSTANTFASTAGLGTLSRSGAAYVLDLPFHGIEPDLPIRLDVTIHLRAVANLLPGDVNFDGVVSVADRNLILANLGHSDPHGLALGDANGDGVVNMNDLQLVPEPATIVGLAMGIATLAAWRIRRPRPAARFC